MLLFYFQCYFCIIATMKRYYVYIILFFFCSLEPGFAQDKQKEIQTSSKLAMAHYRAKDFEKAAPLLLKVYDLSKNQYYFRLYLNAMFELKNFEEAKVRIKQEIEKQTPPRPDFLVHWGFILKSQKRTEEADRKYSRAMEAIASNKGSYLITANAFRQWREYEWAKKVYLKGRENLPGEPFSYELAWVYLYLRNYEKMMEEYLNLIREDEKQLQRVESSLSSAMRLDIDDDLREKFRSQLLKRIQSDPEIIAYNRLMIWFLLQEKQFGGALRQSIALDRRTGGEEAGIFQLGQMAMNNDEYAEARKAFDYILAKGEENPYYVPAYLHNLQTFYLQYTREEPENTEKGNELAHRFKKGLEFTGYAPPALDLIRQYAHLLAFYLNRTEEAVAVLEKGLEIPKLKPRERGTLKTEIADIYVFADDPWEAILLYSQVIDANKDNSLGDEVKLKKARLGYYMGNFSWAKAQLDVLKASTSKLTANDAMDLSMLIGNNLNLDTTAVPLQMFARADLLFFRNKDSLAIATLDSIASNYPYHTLIDDILFRKSKIEIDRNNFETAIQYLERIRNEFSFGPLADDALFMLAELLNDQPGQKEKAKALYKEMLTSHPGSVFIEESREKYRALRKMFPDDQANPYPDDQLTIPEEDLF